jgi:type II secretory pathway component GspD/PulD (secretin)
VNKTRTVYEILTTTVPGAVGTNNTITQEAKPLESPLKLSVTPTVNKHNDNISLKFDFTETIRDSDTYTAPTTANTITTTLNVEPGAVVMMAGLRKETNAITSNGAPILSKYGLSAMFAPLTALFGGENSRSTSGSELLVLINPTVITSKGLKNTIEKAK